MGRSDSDVGMGLVMGRRGAACLVSIGRVVTGPAAKMSAASNWTGITGTDAVEVNRDCTGIAGTGGVDVSRDCTGIAGAEVVEANRGCTGIAGAEG